MSIKREIANGICSLGVLALVTGSAIGISKEHDKYRISQLLEKAPAEWTEQDTRFVGLRCESKSLSPDDKIAELCNEYFKKRGANAEYKK